MATKLKSIRLQRYYGYLDTSFNFVREDGKINDMCVFYGPNGIGKSTVLNAVVLACTARRLEAFSNLDDDRNKAFFKKMVFSEDGLRGYEMFSKDEKPMILTAKFDEDGIEKVVEINSEKGVVRNELTNEDSCVKIDADHPMNMNKFQIHKDYSEKFLDLSNTVYGLNCELGKTVNEQNQYANKKIQELVGIFDGEINKNINTDYDIYADFVINKIYPKTRVHYKNMSDGEKKIATLIRNLCEVPNDIIVIDNIEMHVYFKRHKTMIDKIKSVFPNKQFIATTHSGVLVEKMDKEELYDIEYYRMNEGNV